MTERTIAVVQARMRSTRLPGKVLLPLLGRPLLTRVMARVARAREADLVVLAIPTSAADDPLAELAVQEDWPLVRGPEDDLLGRYLAAATETKADVVIRVTADCPLIDPGIIDAAVRLRAERGADYASNTLEPRTFPRGLDVEVFTAGALERAGREDADPTWREHVTPYIYRHPERFELARLAWSDDLSGHRWSVDTAADYALVNRLYDALGRDDFEWREALAVAEANPGWADLNRDVPQKVVPSGERPARGGR